MDFQWFRWGTRRRFREQGASAITDSLMAAARMAARGMRQERENGSGGDEGQADDELHCERYLLERICKIPKQLLYLGDKS